MCDAFRENVLWQFITGGNWVSHPGGDGITYMVEVSNSSSPLVEGIKDFQITSEHYYLHVDPAVEILATTRFPNIHWYHSTNKAVDMPVAWTKRWGHGRVYYTALGHHADILQQEAPTELLKRAIDWVAEGKDLALKNNLSLSDFGSNLPMY
jgi:type 1 glutamine amidotransferase